MSKEKLTINAVLNLALGYLKKLRRFSFILFLALVLLLYGFIVLRLNTLSNQEPTPEAVSKQVKATPKLKIDQTVLDQLQSLQDNSVSVKALFQEARDNPF